ncbi:MAG: cryptochrome/photolyase family protein, partial [Alphaproteobacteria bacterium]
MKPCIYWLRHDLRIIDNPALFAVANSKKPTIVTVLHPDRWAFPDGAAKLWWLDQSLRALDASLKKLGGEILYWNDTIESLVEKSGADEIHWNRAYTPESVSADTELKTNLSELGVTAVSHQANLLQEPWTIRNKTGGIFKVFTPFWKHCRALGDPSAPVPEIESLTPFQELEGDQLDDWNLRPSKPDWATGFEADWTPGEKGALDKLSQFFEEGIAGYAELRNRPDLENVSRLSPHLAMGEISPKTVWFAAKQAEYNARPANTSDKDFDCFYSEIYWREYAAYLLFNYPHIPDKAWKPQFDAFPWENDPDKLTAWQTGQTGYPLVDAGMRQLWQTGWMHNRVRMVVASFLIKHLLIDWRHGEKWFWDTLLDADRASNVTSWQWVAGSGADASPYFRIFNPFTQGEKFDTGGEYVRKYVPELAKLSNSVIHRPWEASPVELASAGVKLGKTYPL